MNRSLKGLAWIAPVVLVAACGGASFTTTGENGDGGSTSGQGSSGGSSGASGNGSGSGSGGASSGTSSSSSGSSTSSSGASSGTGSSSGGSGSSSSSSGMGTSSGSSSSGVVDGGTGGGPCPANPPKANDPCAVAKVNLTCEWGQSTVPSCDAVATCTAGDAGYPQWIYQAQGTWCSASMCPEPVPEGQSCQSATYCDAPVRRCACSYGGGLATKLAWHCQDQTSVCPLPRPRLGSPCTSTNTVCDYGGCGAVPGGNAEQCVNGVWTNALVLCPATAGQ